MIVKHPGNGLISHGSANLKLLKILYWVITLAFIAVAYGNMPLSKQLKPGFPENTVIGKICLKREIQLSKESVKARLLGFAFPLINLVGVCFWWRNVVKYIDGQCLNKNTFSALGGKYRRNIFTYAETLNYNTGWCIFIIVENTLLIGLEVYSKEVGQEVSYALHHLLCISFINIFHGIYLPFKHLNSSRDQFKNERITKNKKQDILGFYVRSPEMVPRRDFHRESNGTKENFTRKAIYEGTAFVLENCVPMYKRRKSRFHRNNASKYLVTVYEHQILTEIEI